MKFDKKVKFLLNEINIGNLASSVATNVGTAASNFLKTAQNPGKLTDVIGTATADKKKYQKAISGENPIDKKQNTFCYTDYYEYDNTIPQWTIEPITLNGVSLTESDNLGNFKVKITDPDYVFFKKETIDEKNKTRRTSVCIGKKTNLDATGLGTTVVGNELMVGPTQNGLDSGLKTWYIVST